MESKQNYALRQIQGEGWFSHRRTVTEVVWSEVQHARRMTYDLARNTAAILGRVGIPVRIVTLA